MSTLDVQVWRRHLLSLSLRLSVQEDSECESMHTGPVEFDIGKTCLRPKTITTGLKPWIKTAVDLTCRSTDRLGWGRKRVPDETMTFDHGARFVILEPVQQSCTVKNSVQNAENLCRYHALKSVLQDPAVQSVLKNLLQYLLIDV
eukprot:1192266-Rhodomonas_salina.1